MYDAKLKHVLAFKYDHKLLCNYCNHLLTIVTSYYCNLVTVCTSYKLLAMHINTSVNFPYIVYVWLYTYVSL